MMIETNLIATIAETYAASLLALALLALSVQIQSFLTAPLAFVSEEQTPGMPLRGDHGFRGFRAIRAYGNSTENLPAFGFAMVAAICAGTDASFLAWVAWIHVGFRMGFAGIYYAGIGKVAGGPRTMMYVGASLASLVVAGTAVYNIAATMI